MQIHFGGDCLLFLTLRFKQRFLTKLSIFRSLDKNREKSDEDCVRLLFRSLDVLRVTLAGIRCAQRIRPPPMADRESVSYTHLTLPTIYSV